MSLDLGFVRKKARHARSKTEAFKKKQVGGHAGHGDIQNLMQATADALRAASRFRMELDQEEHRLADLEANEINPLRREVLSIYDETRRRDSRGSFEDLTHIAEELRNPVDTRFEPPDEPSGQEGPVVLGKVPRNVNRWLKSRPVQLQLIADMSLCGGFATAFAFSRYDMPYLSLAYVLGSSVVALVGCVFYATGKP